MCKPLSPKVSTPFAASMIHSYFSRKSRPKIPSLVNDSTITVSTANILPPSPSCIALTIPTTFSVPPLAPTSLQPYQGSSFPFKSPFQTSRRSSVIPAPVSTISEAVPCPSCPVTVKVCERVEIPIS